MNFPEIFDKIAPNSIFRGLINNYENYIVSCGGGTPYYSNNLNRYSNTYYNRLIGINQNNNTNSNEETKAKVIEALKECYSKYLIPKGVEFHFSTWIVSAYNY